MAKRQPTHHHRTGLPMEVNYQIIHFIDGQLAAIGGADPNLTPTSAAVTFEFKVFEKDGTPLTKYLFNPTDVQTLNWIRKKFGGSWSPMLGKEFQMSRAGRGDYSYRASSSTVFAEADNAMILYGHPAIAALELEHQLKFVCKHADEFGDDVNVGKLRQVISELEIRAAICKTFARRAKKSKTDPLQLHPWRVLLTRKPMVKAFRKLSFKGAQQRYANTKTTKGKRSNKRAVRSA